MYQRKKNKKQPHFLIMEENGKGPQKGTKTKKGRAEGPIWTIHHQEKARKQDMNRAKENCEKK